MGHAKTALFHLKNTQNSVGYHAFRRDWQEEYLQMLLTNTIENLFYAKEKQQSLKALELHRHVADENPFFMAKALCYARNEGAMRLQPLLGLAVLSEVAPRLFEKIFDKVVCLPSDLAEFSLCLESLGRGQGGRCVKRMAARFLGSLREYDVLKYAGGSRGYSLSDMLRVYHPRPTEDNALLLQAAAGKLDWNDVAPDTLPQIRAFEALKNLDVSDHPEEALRLIAEGRLPYNAVTGAVKKMTPALWRQLLFDMPLFALLRHLNVFERQHLLEDEIVLAHLKKRLTDGVAIARAKILPFRFATAWMAAETTRLRKLLSLAMEAAIAQMPELPGTTAILLDTSGSMYGKPLLIGGTLALSLMRRCSDRVTAMTFDTSVQPLTLDERPVLDSLADLQPGGGTDMSCALKLLIATECHVDRIVVLTDEQQNSGTPFYKTLEVYRTRLNPDVQTFVVNLAPYEGSIAPPEDPSVTWCCGWSDQIISLIARTAEGYASLVETVDAIVLD